MSMRRLNSDHPRDGLETVSNALELFLRTFLIAIGVVVFGFAIFIIATMEAGSKGQGGRWYVAVGAMVALGAVDTQFGRLVRRRNPLFFLTWPAAYRRYQYQSLLLLALAALVLFMCAWLLP
jgi:hypothetical protein